MFDMTDISSLQTCESCLKGKMTKLPFDGKVERAHDQLDLIHTDVCDPLNIGTKYGHTYFITFTNDYSRYRNANFLEKEFLLDRKGSIVEIEEVQVGHEVGCDPRTFKESISNVDASQSFLNGNIKEEIYLSQPEGFTSKGSEHKGCSLYVDDILLIENDVRMMQSTKVWLSIKLLMKDIGEASYILGIKIYRDRSKRILALIQATYVDTILRKFCME
ncbi:uncharacterized protein [Henckelia pumila]|uniref:uncharacterized protein n=1 Tax=Henckelia pumila TaxID=405737 RepID=UPI003C6E03CB